MNKIHGQPPVLGHHSVADFEWFNQAYISLDTNIYVSPPSSLTVPGYQPAAKIAVFLCEFATTKAIDYGRIVTWLRWNNANCQPDVYIRNQDDPPQYMPKNTYRWVIAPGWYVVQRVLNGTPYSLGSFNFSPALSLNTWYHVRCTFIPVAHAGLPDYLGFRLEIEESGVWVQKGSLYETSENRWLGSAASRLGGAVYNWKDYWCWWDDTEFWKLM